MEEMHTCYSIEPGRNESNRNGMGRGNGPEHGREAMRPGGGSTASASRLHCSCFSMCGAGRGGEMDLAAS
jgi:hypothetical protein